MRASPHPRPKMTLRDTADYLQVSERTLSKLVGADDIPYFRVGRQIRTDVVELDCWARGQSASRSEATQ